MRVLWVKMGGFWPLNTGARRRSFHIVSELARRHDVVLMTTHGAADDPQGLARELAHCERVVSLPYAAPKQGTGRFLVALLRSWVSSDPVDLWKWSVPRLRRAVKASVTGGSYDVVVMDFLSAQPNVPRRGRVPVVYFAHNVEHLIWKRLSDVEPRWWRRGLLEIEWRKLRRSESRACADASLTIAVSAGDRARLAVDSPGARVVDVATGVDNHYFQPRPNREVPNRLVFSGSMDWYPNEDAMVYFADVILPRIRREIPDVSLTVVGRNPSAKVKALARHAGIRITGTVDDVRPDMAEGSLYVVPLRVGGGTRLKIFEALAMGKAVLSTTVGAEGLDLVPGTHVALSDDPEDFSREAIALLRDPERRRALGAAGRRLVEERYSWAQVAREFEGHLEMGCAS